MKLNEFTQQINEIDLSSFIGDRGAAAVRSGLGSLIGRSSGEMNTQEKQQYDTYIKSFVGNYANELNQAVKSGLVTTNPTQAKAKTIAPAATQKLGKVRDPKTGRYISATKPATTAQPATAQPATPQPGQQAFSQMANQLTKPTAQAAPAVATQPVPAAQPSQTDLIAQRRQQKQAAAAQAAQQQMAPVSKLPQNQFAQTASNVRQQQQAAAAQAAQQQMAPVSKLPQNQFAQTASNVRKTKQAAAVHKMLPAGNVRQKKQQQAAQISESVLNEAMTISQFIYNKISKGLGNIKGVRKYFPGFKQKAQEIESAYLGAGGGIAGDRAIKDALTQLAQQSYVILKSEPSAKPTDTTSTGTTKTEPTLSSNQLIKLVDKLDNVQRRKLLSLLQKSLTGQKIAIGGQQLDPNNPKDAKIIQKLLAQQSKKTP